jgi:hypothetical protein
MFEQQEGTNYQEVFASVVGWTTPLRRSHGSKSSWVKFTMPLLGPLSLYLGV